MDWMRGKRTADLTVRILEHPADWHEGSLHLLWGGCQLLKLEPYPFGGCKGYRFEYERIRKVDNVQQLGVGFGAIDKGELFALIYQAPRLTFFPRHKDRVEAIARSVAIK